MTSQGTEEIPRDGFGECECCGYNFPNDELREGPEGCMYCRKCYDRAFDLLERQKRGRLDHGLRARVVQVMDGFDETITSNHSSGWRLAAKRVVEQLTTALAAAPAEVPREMEYCTCDDCGREIIFDYAAVDKGWNRAVGTKDNPCGEGVHLCIDCFCKRAFARNVYPYFERLFVVGDRFHWSKKDAKERDLAQRKAHSHLLEKYKATKANLKIVAKQLGALKKVSPGHIAAADVEELRDKADFQRKLYNRARQMSGRRNESAEAKHQVYVEVMHDLTRLIDSAAGPGEPPTTITMAEHKAKMLEQYHVGYKAGRGLKVKVECDGAEQPAPPSVEERMAWFITLDYLHERDDCVGFELAKTLMGVYDESITTWLRDRDREGDGAGTKEVE